MCVVNPEVAESKHYDSFLAARPRIAPNMTMLELADGLLDLNGDLIKAARRDREARLAGIKVVYVPRTVKGPRALSDVPRVRNLRSGFSVCHKVLLTINCLAFQPV